MSSDPTGGRFPTALGKKLGLRPGDRLALDHAPAGWSVSDPPENVDIVAGPEPADLIISFYRVADELEQRLPDLARRIFPAGALWVAWPDGLAVTEATSLTGSFAVTPSSSVLWT
jgi:hypothetical protein